jgi:hypothetical protein
VQSLHQGLQIAGHLPDLLLLAVHGFALGCQSVLLFSKVLPWVVSVTVKFCSMWLSVSVSIRSSSVMTYSLTISHASCLPDIPLILLAIVLPSGKSR